MITATTADSALYEGLESRFFASISEILQRRLLLYCVTGSLARKEIVPGWSDIDIFIVVDSYDRAIFEAVKDSLKKLESGIKIGVTIMIPKELMNTFPKPSRMYDVIDQIRSGVYLPRVYEAERMVLEAQDESVILAANRSEFGLFLQFFKKGLMAGLEDYPEQEVHKNLTILLKILLREKGVKAYSYNDVVKNLSYLSVPSIIFIMPSTIIETPHEKSTRYAYYIDFLNWIDQNHDALLR